MLSELQFNINALHFIPQLPVEIPSPMCLFLELAQKINNWTHRETRERGKNTEIQMVDKYLKYLHIPYIATYMSKSSWYHSSPDTFWNFIFPEYGCMIFWIIHDILNHLSYFALRYKLITLEVSLPLPPYVCFIWKSLFPKKFVICICGIF